MDWFALAKGKQKKIVFSLDENNLFLAVMKGKKLIVSDQMLLESINHSTIYSALKYLVTKHYLAGNKATLVLPDLQYQLLMTDKLPVPDEEMTNAIRWKMKGLLDYPINDAALDTFSVPSHGTGNKRNTVFVVATEKVFIQDAISAFDKALIPLESVDISLFSLRNLMMTDKTKNKTQLLISLSGIYCSLTVINNHQVYLVRKPKISSFSVESSVDEEGFEQMLLEIQRSTDYCLSELKLPAPSEVIFSPSFLSQKKLMAYLTKYLNQTIRCLDLNDIISYEREIPDKLQKSLCLSVGGALETGI